MKKTLFSWIAVLLAVMMFAGCAGGSGKSGNYYKQDTAAEAYRDDYDYNGYANEAEKPAAESKASDSSSRSNIPDGVKIIYTATVEMETTTYDEALNTLKALTEEVGGYIENISNTMSGYYRNTSMTVRVPAGSFRDFLDRSGEAAQVLSSRENAKDVSEYYYDTENRLTTEKTKLARLQELLRKADTMTDIIELENAISDTEYMIDDLSGTLRHYDSLVSYSTIEIRLNEVGVLRGQEVPPITFGERLQKAWKTGCENAVEGLQDFTLYMAESWFGWLVFLFIAFILFLIIRGIVRKNRARRNGTLPKSRRELRKEARIAKREAKAAAKAAAKSPAVPAAAAVPEAPAAADPVVSEPAVKAEPVDFFTAETEAEPKEEKEND